MKKKLLGALLALLAGLGLWQGTPNNPTPSSTPSPTVEASVSPTATVTPAPTVTIPPMCELPPSDGKCTYPPKDTPRYEEIVEEAQRLAANNGFVKDGKVVDEVAYTVELARIIKSMGYCAIQGTTVIDEVWIKESNGRSEHWDVVRSDLTPLTMYAAYCFPAKF